MLLSAQVFVPNKIESQPQIQFYLHLFCHFIIWNTEWILSSLPKTVIVWKINNV